MTHFYTGGHSRQSSRAGDSHAPFPQGSQPTTPLPEAAPSLSNGARRQIHRMTVAMPPPASVAGSAHSQYSHYPSLSRQSSFYGRQSGNSPAFFDSILQEVHSTLYAAPLDKAAIVDVIERLYEVDATFENPLTTAIGRKRIAEHFCFGGFVPGDVWSELEEVSMSEDFHGHRSLIFTHTKTRSLVPWLSGATADAHRLQLASSNANTPYSVRTPAFTPHESPNREAQGLSFDVPSDEKLSIRKLVLTSLTTLSLRMHTTLKFNELGRIVHHEDTIGIREIGDALPIVAPLYHFQRRAFGVIAGTLSRKLVLRGEKVADEELNARGAEPKTRASSPAVSRKGSIVQGLALHGMTTDTDADSPPMAPNRDPEV